LPDVFDRNLLKTNDRVRKQVTIFRNRLFGCSELGQRQVGLGVQSVIGAVAGKKTRVAGGGDHRRVVRRESAAGEKDVDTAASGLGFKCAAQFAIRGDAAGDEDRARGVLLGRGKGLRDENRYHGALEAGDQIKRCCARKRSQRVGAAFAAGERLAARLDFGIKLWVAAQMVEHGRLDSAKAEIVGIARHLRLGEAHSVGVAVRSEAIDDRPAGIAEGEHARDFVVGFTGSVVARAADARVCEPARAVRGLGFHVVENRVTAGNDQAHGRELRLASGCASLEKHRVDVAFEMIYRDERLAERERENLAVRHANEQRADQSGPLSHCNRVHIAERDVRLLDGLAHDGNDLPQVLARGEFGHHAAVFSVNIVLRSDDVRENAITAGDDRGRGLVARRFDAENQMFFCSHTREPELPARRKPYVSMRDAGSLSIERVQAGDMSGQIKKVRKAVLPVAGLGTRFLPATKSIPKEMLTVVDKPLIQYAVEECAASGIEQLIFVTGRHKSSIEDHFDFAPELESFLEQRGKAEQAKAVHDIGKGIKFSYTRQSEALGLGHAVLCAAELVGDEPFVVLLGDVIMDGKIPATRELVEIYEATGMGVIHVERVPRERVHLYGIIDAQPEKNSNWGERLLRVKSLVEKPKPEKAPSNLAITGRYLLPPEIFDYIKTAKPGAIGEIQLTDGLCRVAENNKLLACIYDGKTLDAGDKLGFLLANVELGLKDPKLGENFRQYLRGLKL